MKTPTAFDKILLDEEHEIWLSKPTYQLTAQDVDFAQLWAIHPEEYHTIMMRGKLIKTPRWQQAYGANYRYTGARNNALPIPSILQPIQNWAKENIDDRLNGLLINWYDGSKKHYIGQHRDDTRDLVEGSPIVTISFGEERIFRMRPWRKKGFIDTPLGDLAAIVIPWRTNLTWTHEVPHFQRYQGRRISVTLRVFKNTAQ